MKPQAILRRVIEVCPFSIVVAEPLGKIALANDEAERMFGFAHDELIGQTVDLLVPTSLRAQHARHRGQFAAHPAIRLARNLSGRRKDGTEFPAEVGLNQIPTNEGFLVLAVIVDISERRRADRLKDEFVATVSHELRTPLTSISGALSLLVATAGATLPAAGLRLLKIAQSNSQRLVRLVGSILDMDKIESGKVVFVIKRVEVRTLIEQAIEANRAVAEGFNVRIMLDPASDSGELRSDPDWLVQVVGNLLSNAVKFSPPGEEVTVGIEKHGASIRVWVRDHGQGVPEAFRPRIFEKFAQADNSDARTKGGAGLGLSIVKQIVTRLGGEVGFANAPGGGAIFHVELPLVDKGSGEHAIAARPDRVGVESELQP